MFDIQWKTTKHAKKEDTWAGKQNSGRVFAHCLLGLGFKPQHHHPRNCNSQENNQSTEIQPEEIKKKKKTGLVDKMLNVPF